MIRTFTNTYLSSPFNSQLRTRPPAPTGQPHVPPPSARLRPSPRRQPTRAEQHLRARDHGHLSGRLFRHPHGRPRHQFPLQPHGRAHVLRQRHEFPGHGTALRTARRRGLVCGGFGALFHSAQLRRVGLASPSNRFLRVYFFHKAVLVKKLS